MLYSAPYVKPGPYSQLAFVRRALASGAIPFVATPDPAIAAELIKYNDLFLDKFYSLFSDLYRPTRAVCHTLLR